MAVTITLLGPPSVERDGATIAPGRGHKHWGLLAYLLLTERPPSREHLCSLLFAEADDPLRALRWNLSALRRCLGDPDGLRGDRPVVDLPAGAQVDVRIVTREGWREAVGLPGLGRELLEGMSFGATPAFDAWLLNERAHLRTASEAVLREGTLALLARGEGREAIGLATRLVVMDPLNEAAQALLIRAYAATGDQASADRQLAACTELFRRELGVEPGPAVLAAALVPAGSLTVAPVSGRAAARAQLDAGRAAIGAGALDAGLECLRRAVVEAGADQEMKAQVLVELGTAGIHSGRAALKDEGAAAMHEVLALRQGNDDELVTVARRELGWLEILEARYDRAERWLREGEHPSTGGRGWIDNFLGVALTDVGRYGSSLEWLERSLSAARAAQDRKLEARALAFIGRAHLLRGETDRARVALEASLDIVLSDAWIGFQPFPEAFLGEVALIDGDLDVAGELLEHAFALGCQIGDACYESPAARGLGLLADARGDEDEAFARLEDAVRRLVERPDYTWMNGYALEGLCRVAVARSHPGARGWLDELESFAGRTGTKEFAARAHLYRSALGDPAELEAAAAIAADIDNPWLHAMLADRAVRTA